MTIPRVSLAVSFLLAAGCSNPDSIVGGEDGLPPYGESGDLTPSGGGDHMVEPTGDPPVRNDVLAADQVGPQGLAVHDDVLYWIDINGTELHAAGVNGGGIATLSDLESSLDGAPFDFAVDDLGVLLTDSFGQRLVRVPLTGGKPEEVATFGGAPLAMALANDRAYVAVDQDGVYEVNLDTGEPTLLAEITGSPISVAAGGNNLYVATAEGALYRTGRDGSGTVDKLASGIGFSGDLVADSQYVYYIDQYSRRVMRVSPGNEPLIVAYLQYGLTGLSIDRDYAYFTTAGDEAVKRVAKSGGDVYTLAENQRSPEAIASDGTAVYWTSSDDGVIWKLPLD